MPRIKVAVLMGGKSAEREVSLSTGRQVLAALDPGVYDAFPVDTATLGGRALPPVIEPSLPDGTPTPQADPDRGDLSGIGGASSLPSPWEAPLSGGNRPDVALICLHGRFGEDGTIQGMLELLEIPYTGSGVLASALAMDKVMSKKLFICEGIPTPQSLVVRSRADADSYLRQLAAGTAAVPCPVVVKPSRQGSTIGISIVQDPANMAAALSTALAYDDEVLVEQYIAGIEITAPVLGNDELEALPLIEIIPASGVYDYEAKYTPGATEEICPARLPADVTAAAQDLAIRSHRALGCRGVSRTDMMVTLDENGAPRADGIWVLEVNTIPGMTPTSLLPRSAETAGLSFPQLVDRMVRLALEGRSVETSSACV